MNEVVGRRTVEKGFVGGGSISGGVIKTDIGGGVSQFATTMFNAAFFAGLEFDRYQAHSIYFNRYPYGREATISWPQPDLIIHNPTPYGVLIWPTYDETSITVSLYSTRYVDVEQTGQTTSFQDQCTRVRTERTRTYLHGEVAVDHVSALYRPGEGFNCDGSPSDPSVTTLHPEPEADDIAVSGNGEATAVADD
jgi:vancomycin resistance protein YoaR